MTEFNKYMNIKNISLNIDDYLKQVKERQEKSKSLLKTVWMGTSQRKKFFVLQIKANHLQILSKMMVLRSLRLWVLVWTHLQNWPVTMITNSINFPTATNQIRSISMISRILNLDVILTISLTNSLRFQFRQWYKQKTS